MSKIIAVDFDGTLFTNAWPNIGEPIEGTINAVKAEQAAGSKIILWTNRIGDKLQEAVDACKKQGIEFDAVNDNLPEIVEEFGVNCRKIFANEYWDDRAVKVTEYGPELMPVRAVMVERNPNGDTRTANADVTYEEFQKANRSHIKDVRNVMHELSKKLNIKGQYHDWTKLSGEMQFYKDFKDTLSNGSDFTKKTWYKMHVHAEKHHPLSLCHENVDLFDIIEMIADCVCAGKARTGDVTRLALPNYILQEATMNTWEFVERMVVVDED